MASNRLWTYIGSQRANFGQCVVASLTKAGQDEVNVKVNFDSKGLTLTPGLEHDLVLRHPPFCPVLEANEVQGVTGHVAVSSAVILESSDKKVLITRRPKHMRTFPDVWVPPGGGCEAGETILQAGLREVREETGLCVDVDKSTVQPLCLWESVYPPILSKGKPKRHSIVVYFHAKIGMSAEVALANVTLDPEETNACAWLDLEVLRLATNYGLELDASKTIVIHELVDNTLTPTLRDLSFIRAEVPLSGIVDVERISTGTRFALEQFLLKVYHSSSSL